MNRISFSPRYAGLGAPVVFDLSDTTGDEARDRGLALQRAALTGMHLQKLHLGQVDASGLYLPGLRLTECSGSLNLRGATASDSLVELCTLVVTANNATNLERAGFAGCNLDGSVFAGAFMPDANVSGGSLRNADLTGIVAPNSTWAGSKTDGAKLSGWIAPFAYLKRLAGHETIIAESEGSEEDRTLLRRCQWEGVDSVKRQLAVAAQLAADEAAGIVRGLGGAVLAQTSDSRWSTLDRAESSASK